MPKRGSKTYRRDGTIADAWCSVEVHLAGVARRRCASCSKPAKFFARALRGRRVKSACGRDLASIVRALAEYKSVSGPSP